MIEISTIGLDIAKRVFQVHAVDAADAVVLRRQLRRSEVVKFFARLPPCLAVIRRMLAGETVTQQNSGLSAREWRELTALLARPA